MLNECIFVINDYTVQALGANPEHLLWLFSEAAAGLNQEWARANTDRLPEDTSGDDCWGIDVFLRGIKFYLVAVPEYIQDQIYVRIGLEGVEDSAPVLEQGKCRLFKWPLQGMPDKINKPPMVKDLFTAADGPHRVFSNN